MEGLLIHFLIHLWSHIAAWIFTILNIYALIYIIGLYNSVKSLPHIISLDRIIIRIGYQSSIKLDIRNIESVRIANEKSDIFEKTSKEIYFAILNTDSPQYEIFLKEPTLMKSTYGRKKYVKTVVFRADNPVKMIETLNTNMKTLNNR